MYTAIDISSYILTHCRQKDINVTNLKLQKLLYFVQCAFIKNKKELCFGDKIEAWSYGPVISDVYNLYSKYVSNNILSWKEPLKSISCCDQKIIDTVLDAYAKKNTWDLVEITHSQNPWKLTYEKGKKKVIPNSLLFNFALTSTGE